MPQWVGIISLVVGFGRPAGARFLVDSGDALLWVLGVALIIAAARLWRLLRVEAPFSASRASDKLSTRMEPRYDGGVSISRQRQRYASTSRWWHDGGLDSNPSSCLAVVSCSRNRLNLPSDGQLLRIAGDWRCELTSVVLFARATGPR